MCKGLPASGKSTWSKEQKNLKRINKDDLRSMLDDSRWSRKNEEFILIARDTIIDFAFRDGYSVIVDDTNLAPKHEENLRYIAKCYGAKFEIKDFTDIPLETCITRDLKRQNSVGEKVIRDMYNRYLKPKTEPYNPGNLPKAIICDIDGTLSVMGDRSPFDWEKVGRDAVNSPVDDLLSRYSTYQVKKILVSGRDSICRKETEAWLEENDIAYDELFMRPEGDTRKDSIVKKEIFDNNIRDKYNVLFVLDDRNQVVEMWRDLGLNCFQVREGNF
jgi:predicted kinase